MEPFVSVIIPTFRRAPYLKHALEGLKNQTFRNFETIIVVKPAGDETGKILEKYKHDLRIKTILQNDEFVSKAYNLGLQHAKGEIIAIMDDDSVPYINWLEKHVEAYNRYPKLGGISGAALNAEITEEGKLIQVPERSIMYTSWHQYYYGRFSYNRPLSGMLNWWIFFGKDGLVHQRPLPEEGNFQGPVSSLLLMGANMSVKKKATEGLNIDEELVLGFCYEQLLAYQIWRRGYKLLHDPNIKVLHIVHSQSLGRFFQTPSRAAHRDAEYILSFFILKQSDNEISWSIFVLQLLSLIVSRALQTRIYGLRIALSRIYGLLYGFTAGCAYHISRIFRGNFSIKNSLLKFME